MNLEHDLIPKEITDDILNSNVASLKVRRVKKKENLEDTSSEKDINKSTFAKSGSLLNTLRNMPSSSHSSSQSVLRTTASRTFGRGYHQSRVRRPYGPQSSPSSVNEESLNSSDSVKDSSHEEIIHNATLENDDEFIRKFQEKQLKKEQNVSTLDKSTDLDTSSESLNTTVENKKAPIPKRDVIGILRRMKKAVDKPEKVEQNDNNLEDNTQNVFSSSESERSAKCTVYGRSLYRNNKMLLMRSLQKQRSEEDKPNPRDDFLQRRIESHKLGRRIKESYSVRNQLTDNTDLLVPQVLVHSMMKLNPENFQNVCLNSQIKRALIYMDQTKMSDIQEYCWPAINRGDNVLVISKNESYMAYLPVLCTVLVENDYSDLGSRIGPCAIIFCATQSYARKVEAKMRKLTSFLSKSKAKENETSVPIAPRIFLQLNNRDIVYGCEVVITTPKCFLRRYSSLIDSFLQLNRLCHIVFDETHVISERYMGEVTKFFQFCQLMLKHRNKVIRNIQVILNSEKWTNKIFNICNLTPVKPTVCIKDPIEAALYGKANIQLMFLEKENKIEKVAELLKHYKSQKSLVITNTYADVKELCDNLVVRGFEVVSITEKMKKMEIQNIFLSWNNASSGSYLVLVTTDECLVDVRINSASYLLHYSLPGSWNTFVERFYTTMNLYSSPFVETNNSTTNPKICILVDETHAKALPRLVKLLERVKIDVGDKLRLIAKQVSDQNQINKAKSTVQLCPMLLSSGECPRDFCKYRHKIFKSFDENILNLKFGSKIKLKLLQVFDISHYLVRFYDSDEHKYASLLIDMVQYYQKHDYSVVDVLVGHRYTLKMSPTLFYRCEVLEIEGNLCQIYLIDKGELKECEKLDLCDLPEQFANIPQQTFFIYVSDLKPYDNETVWDSSGRNELEQFFKSLGTNRPGVYFTGIVELVLNRNVWLSDVHIFEYFDKTKMNVDKLKVRSELIERKLAENNPDHLIKLKELCIEGGMQITMERAVKTEIIEPKKEEPVVLQRAFLTIGEHFKKVNFLNADRKKFMYISRFEFNKILNDLTDDITKAASKSLYPKVTSLKVGKYYLGLKDGIYHRVLLEEILDKNQASCFLIDDGYDITLPINSLKIIQSWMITRLPQQAIRCRLFGVNFNSEELIACEGRLNMWAKCVHRDEDGTFAILLRNDDATNPHINIDLLRTKNGIAISGEELKEEDFIDIDNEKPQLSNSEDELSPSETQPKENATSLFNVDDEDDDDEFFDCVIGEDQLNNYCKKIFDFDANDLINAIENKMKVIEKDAPSNLEPTKEDKEIETFNLAPAMLEKGKALVPDVIWYQKNEMVVLKIQLSSVQIYEINFTSQKMYFNATIDDKTWELELIFYDEIIEEKSKHQSHGLEIIVKIFKRNSDLKWPRLLNSEKRYRNIHADLNHEISDDEVDRVVPILQNVGKIPCEDNDDDFNIDIGSDIDNDSSDMSENFDDN